MNPCAVFILVSRVCCLVTNTISYDALHAFALLLRLDLLVDLPKKDRGAEQCEAYG